jgi:hypothetical protein
MGKQPRQDGADATVELLKDILIVQLGVAGVAQQSIRAVVGCSNERVNRIVRHLKVKPGRRAD